MVDTALAPLRARRAELETPRSEQRRLVTVVFADLVDFTVLSRRLDAEDTREVVGAYFARWQRAIEDQGGVVEKFIGDAVMAVFGLSRSYEDDAHRAIRAALAMLASSRSSTPTSAPLRRHAAHARRHRHRRGGGQHPRRTARHGVRRGRSDGQPGQSRLQAAAPVDRVLVSCETQRQVRGAFGIDERPGSSSRGSTSRSTPSWCAPSGASVSGSTPSAASRASRPAPSGGSCSCASSRTGSGTSPTSRPWRVVTVMGDAGVGKSRLLFDFDAWLAERPESVWWFRGRAAPSSQNTVNVLLRDVLTSRLDIQIDDTSERAPRLTDGFVSALGPDSGPRSGALVGAWLGFDVDTTAFDLPSEPQALRDQGTEALGGYFRALSQQAPVVILLEDLHWADEGTLRWLDAVAPVWARPRCSSSPRRGPPCSRPGPGGARGSPTTCASRSARSRGARAASWCADPQPGRGFPDDLVDLVIDSAEGNPFYIEELVTWLIDAGVVVRGEPHWFVVDELVRTVAVPSTLKGVLQSRLDALSLEERNLLQRASVVGRVFWDLAVAYLDDDRDDPRPGGHARSLDILRRREVLLQREVSHFASAREFLFKHALLRDVAYDGVLRAHRERYHQRAADWLAETSAAVGRADEYAAVIADHFERAHDPAAATWYLRAGKGQPPSTP